MFSDTPFDGDLTRWKIKDSCSTYSMFSECPVTEKHKPTGGNPEYEYE